ncbi:phage BR0599 family protein [Ruegeria sp.]|uniref:phage BR0599 family protein n=1 Tax=Ruegeria sp. TaxID=1879320 RepID=UPI003B5A76CC
MAQNIAADEGFSETEVTIYKTFSNDPDGELVRVFVGRIRGIEQKWARYELICENDFTAFNAKALGQVVQRPCRWAHYHTGCTLNLADWQVPGTATALSEDVVTVTEAALQPDGYYSSGVIQFGTGMAMIRAHAGTQLTILGVLPGLADEITTNGSASVQIAPGCNLSDDLTTGDCHNKFNNLLNFGGFSKLSENPFDGRRIDG